MATVTIQSGPFAAGTEVGAYRALDQVAKEQVDGQAPPDGPVQETATVAANGTITFAALARGYYIAAAPLGETWGRLSFSAGLDYEATGNRAQENETLTGKWRYVNGVQSLAEPLADEDVTRLVDVQFLREAPLNIMHPEFEGSLSAAVERANAAPSDTDLAVYIPGEANPESGPIALTKSRLTVYGDGPSAKVLFTGTDPSGFVLDGRYCVVKGLYVEAEGDPAGGYAFEVNGADCRLDNVVADGFAGMLRQGETAGGARLSVLDFKGTASDASLVPWWAIKAGPGSKFSNCHTVGGTPGVNRSAYVRVGGSSTNASDGMHFVNFVCFTNPGSSGTQGMAYGVDLVGTGHGVNNARFIDCGFDGTDVAAVRYVGDADTQSNRNIGFTRCRWETASGQILNFNHANAGGNPAQVFNWDSCLFFFGNDAAWSGVPVVCTGAKASGIAFSNCDFLASGDRDLPALMRMGVQRWSSVGNRVYRGGAGSVGLDYIYENTNEPDGFLTDGTQYDATNVGFFKHFAYVANHGSQYQALDGQGASPVIKRTDENVNNSSTLQDDDELVFAIGPNEKWAIEVVLDVVAVSATADLKVAFATPSGGSYKFQRSSVFDGVAQASSPTALSTGIVSVGLDNLETGLVLRGWIASAATAGTVRLQWAQVTPTAENVTIKAGSYMKLTRCIYG